MRTIIILACAECKRRNYTGTKNKQKHGDRFASSKYCKFCNKHTEHKETK